MKKAILIICLLAACATPGRVTLSYHATMDRTSSEAAWTRAGSFMARLSLLQNLRLETGSDTVIRAGGTLITREFSSPGTVTIRVSRAVILPSHGDGKIPDDVKRTLKEEREHLKGILEYIKTGSSLHMKDLDIPLRYEMK